MTNKQKVQSARPGAVCRKYDYRDLGGYLGYVVSTIEENLSDHQPTAALAWKDAADKLNTAQAAQ